jgi:glycosyltransferase involved in cell wall biosynthesis
MSHPFVSCICPTYNRRKFLPNLLKIFNEQTYPKNYMELIIIDDSDVSNQDLIDDHIKKYPDNNIKYVYSKERILLGKKRNMLNDMSTGDYIVCFDDDDYYPPERVSHAIIKMLTENVNLAGSSILHIYYTKTGEIREYGPYGKFHATNGTFAYHKSFLKNHKYDEKATKQEEPYFLNNFTCPMVQLSPMKTMLCIAHQNNTFDKDNIKNVGKLTNYKLKNFIKNKELLDFYKKI